MHLIAASRVLVFLALLLSYISPSVKAQDALRIMNATRITEKIKIDGSLDDGAWLQTKPFDGKFYQRTPDNGAESAYRSKIYIAYDNRAIYVGAMLYDPDPQSIPQELSERDNMEINVDLFGVSFDTYNKGQTGFTYIVSAAGVQGDILITSHDFDENWNSVWNSEVSINKEGWVVEMEIPYSALRFANNANQVWGINFYRNSKRLNEETSWNFINQEVEGFINQSGELHGLNNITPPLRLSFSPYFSVGAEYSSEAKSFSRSIAGGMDMKLGISESFTLDLSLIPDFSQVQSDNVVLNLSPFEVHFDENRPFFTEGVELFSKGNVFYSRRIGQVNTEVDEDALLSSEKVTEMPNNSQLINATKLSGRTGSGAGLGFFNSVTAKTYAVIEDTVRGSKRELLLEPITNFNILVYDQNLKNNSYIGLINTNVSRSHEYRNANVTLANFRFRDKTNTWSLSGSGGISQVLELEDDRQVKTKGFASRLYFSKVSGKFQFSSGVNIESDNWDINDLGFIRRNNEVSYSTEIDYNIFKPFSVFNSMSISLQFEYEQLYKPRTYVGAEYNGHFNAQFRNFFDVGFGFEINPYDNYDYYEPRESDYFYKSAGNYEFFAYMESDSRKKFKVDMFSGMWHRPKDNAKVYFAGFEPSYRVNNRLNFVYNLRTSIVRNTKGYVNSLLDSNDNLISIIFGQRHQNTFTNTVGLNYTFTNKIGLSFRMRHYWSWVEYKKFYDLTNTGELGTSNYSGLDANAIPLHNTTFNAFNIDLVYSWQVAPGSFFTAVWKNQIYSDSEFAQKELFNNLRRTFAEYGTNSLTLKLVYYVDIAYFRKNDSN